MIDSFAPFSPYGEKIQAMTEVVFDEFEATLPPISDRAAWGLNQLRDYSTRPSKRLRGGLAAASYDDAASSKFSEVGLRLGAAIEIMQNFLLVTDDVIDHSSLRRGKPTVHELYKKTYQSSEHEAGMAGVLIGALAQHAATFTVANLDADEQATLQTLRWLQTDIAITGIGQIDDIAQSFGSTFTKNDLMRKYRQKSSYYSIVNPLTCGFMLAGKENVRDDAEAVGIPAGIAFQLRDDYLGLYGDTTRTGKANLDDIHEGKYTVMIQHGLELANKPEVAAMKKILGNTSADTNDLATLCGILEGCGATQAAMNEAKQYAEQAKTAVGASTIWSEPFAETLKDLIDFSITRDK